MKLDGNLRVIGVLEDVKLEVLADDPAIETLGDKPRLWFGPNGELKTFTGVEIRQAVTGAELEQAVSDAVSDGGFVTGTELNQAVSDAVDAGGFVTGTELEQAVSDAVGAGYVTHVAEVAALTHTVTHNLNNMHPIVQVVDTDTNVVIGVDEIKFVDADSLTVTLAEASTPTIIVHGLKNVAG